ncbi:hypothetical protein MtrunA17_Chr6g0465841 [Medicago truncatula]|uniref:Uncharacterized protein n=1 Tax=Medicago truncatula TaxID=3880 RepID=A0A396HD08_MEDTR|nr:hypothetical protein MtrunA17_Chr6g0465841 [Medicago truncatula]
MTPPSPQQGCGHLILRPLYQRPQRPLSLIRHLLLKISRSIVGRRPL